MKEEQPQYIGKRATPKDHTKIKKLRKLLKDRNVKSVSAIIDYCFDYVIKYRGKL